MSKTKVHEQPSTTPYPPATAPSAEMPKQPVGDDTTTLDAAAMPGADKPAAPNPPDVAVEALTAETQAEGDEIDPAQSMATTDEMQGVVIAQGDNQAATADEPAAVIAVPDAVTAEFEISCLVQNLSAALKVVTRAVATRTTMPALNCVLFETIGGRLRLQATNLEVGITQFMDCQVQREGAVAVPAKLFADFVADLPPDKLELRLDPRHILHIECGRNIANIKCLPAEDFPLVPTYQNQQALATVESAALGSAIDEVEFAAARDDSRPVLTGVLMRFTSGEVTMAGTDGYRLAERRLTVEGVADSPPIIVPARVLKELSNILGNGSEPLTIAVTANRNQALFHTADLDLVARLIDGPFPNYGQIIPQSYQSRMVMTTRELRHTVQMAETFARDSMHIVKLMIAPGGEDGSESGGVMTIIAHAAEAGDNRSELDGLLEGEGVQIAFNAKLVLDVLAATTSQLVALETNSSTSPGVLRPVGQEEGNTGIYVIMPMNLFK